MFRGIDPEGLTGLAHAVDSKTAALRQQTRAALQLLNSNGKPAAATAIGATAGRVELWGIEIADNLRWRASVIESGQRVYLDSFARARAEFAAAAVFSMDNVNEAYRRWVEQSQASRRRVDQTVAAISDWLDQSWSDWDVTNNDLHNIWSSLEILSGDELDRVLGALSPAQLERWIEEMGNSINGFSRREKQQLFDLLAGDTSGVQLGRVHDAILSGGSQQDTVDFGIAIQHHGPDQAIVDFVAYVMAQDLAHHDYAGVAPALAAGGLESSVNIDAVARSIVAGSDTLALIVVDSLVTAHIEDTGDACIEIDALESLLRALSRGSDPSLKAEAFVSIATLGANADDGLRLLLRNRYGVIDTSERDLLGSRTDDKRATELITSGAMDLLSGASLLLTSDAERVVTELAARLDSDGSLTTAYLHQLIDSDRIGDLSRIVDSVRRSEIVDQRRFSSRGTDPGYQFPHAQNLAFLAATLNGALERYADSAKRDIDMIDWAAKIASLFAGPLARSTSYLGGLAEGAVSLSAQDIALGGVTTRTKREIDDGLAQLTRIVESRLRPQLPADPALRELGEALMWWLERYGAIYAPDQ